MFSLFGGGGAQLIEFSIKAKKTYNVRRIEEKKKKIYLRKRTIYDTSLILESIYVYKS